MDNRQSFTLGRVAATIPVSDIERAKGFYRKVFGFSVAFENGNPVGFVVLKHDAAEIHLTWVKNHKGAAHNIAHIMVSDAEAVFAKCTDIGARIIKGPKDASWNMRTFVVADPDGNRLDIGMPQ